MRPHLDGSTPDQAAKQGKSVSGGAGVAAVIQIQLAEGFFARLWGLHALHWRHLPRPLSSQLRPLPPSPLQLLSPLPSTPSITIVPALLLRPCRAVHTLGLRDPIDVVFLGAQNRILRCVPRLAPNRVAIHWQACAVVELPAGYCTGSSWPSALSCALFDSKIVT